VSLPTTTLGRFKIPEARKRRSLVLFFLCSTIIRLLHLPANTRNTKKQSSTKKKGSMTDLDTVCTIEGLFETFYTSAIVPPDAEPMIHALEFNRLMAWQRAIDYEDGPGVLTVEKLRLVTPTVMFALQRFAFKVMCAHPSYKQFVSRGTLATGVAQVEAPAAGPAPSIPAAVAEEAPATSIEEESEADVASEVSEDAEKNVADEDFQGKAPAYFATAQEYIEYDIKVKLAHFNKYKMHKRETPPNRKWFPSEEIYEAALAGRTLLCTKPTHEGNRVLYPGQFYTNSKRICKACQCKAVRKPASVYETAEAWQAATVARNCKPKEDEFPDKAEYDKAMVMHVERRKESKRENAKAHKRAREA
jgi:hypothetical protein